MCKKGEKTINSVQSCEKETKNLYDCYRNNMRVEPLCLMPFNDAKECLFKTDNS